MPLADVTGHVRVKVRTPGCRNWAYLTNVGTNQRVVHGLIFKDVEHARERIALLRARRAKHIFQIVDLGGNLIAEDHPASEQEASRDRS